jgi:hypothetical protein
MKMRKLKAITMCLACILFAGVVYGQDIKQNGYEYIRKVVSAADSSTLGATNSDWGQRAAYSHGIDIPSGTQAVLISVIGNHASDPDDGTASVKFYMYRSGGPAQLVGTWQFTIGDLRCNLKPRDSTQQGAKSKWAESATLTSQNWISTPLIVGSGTDTCVVLKIPTYGYAYITAEVTAITAAHTVDILMSAVGSTNPDGVVTGTVTANAGTNLNTSALATAANQLADGHNVTIDNAAGTAAVEVQMTSPVKTTAINVVDAWQVVTAATTVVGNVIDLTGAYGDSCLYIEAAQIEAVAHAGGAGVKVQVSEDQRTWVDYTATTDLNLTADTAAVTTTVGAVTVDVNTVIDLTDATTGDFDVQGRAWFIKDGTIANSEVVFTKSNATHVVTMLDAVRVSHASGVSVYDRVDQFVVNLRQGISYARVVYRNGDNDCDIATRARLNTVTAQ